MGRDALRNFEEGARMEGRVTRFVCRYYFYFNFRHFVFVDSLKTFFRRWRICLRFLWILMANVAIVAVLTSTWFVSALLAVPGFVITMVLCSSWAVDLVVSFARLTLITTRKIALGAIQKAVSVCFFLLWKNFW